MTLSLTLSPSLALALTLALPLALPPAPNPNPNPSQAHHWAAIERLASAPLPPGVHLTLRACLAASLLEALPRVHTITRSAAQTAAHRATLAALAAEWAARPLRFAASDGGGPYALKGSSKRAAAEEELPALLDADGLLTRLEESTVEVQAVLGSAHLGPLHEVALA